jgi:hypothetical protein
MAWNTSCRVMNSRLGPPRAILSRGMPLRMPLATAAGITATPASRATEVSAMTITAEFLARFSFLSR